MKINYFAHYLSKFGNDFKELLDRHIFSEIFGELNRNYDYFPKIHEYTFRLLKYFIFSDFSTRSILIVFFYILVFLFIWVKCCVLINPIMSLLASSLLQLDDLQA